MFLSIWVGVVMAGAQTGCSTLSKKEAEVRPPVAAENRPAQPPANPGSGRSMRNPDYYTIPKVPPPGARNTYSSVNVNGPYIAITFDDGPHPTNTPRLLNILAQRNIKATFFVVGQLAKEYPQIIRRILAEGHEIANHTLTHPTLTKVSDDRIRRELGETHKALVDIAGYHTRLFRPPGGATNARLKEWFHNEYGYSTILWTVDPQDWKRPGVSVVTSRLVNGARPGAILLCHDLHAPTVDAMPGTLDQLLAKGFKFVTVSQLLNMESSAPASSVTAVAPSSDPAPFNPNGSIVPSVPSDAPIPFLKGQPPAVNGIPSEGGAAPLR
ncbi:peptidoglycan/xylan/chitin deacetylase (PgdA/CDA1 family) [Roseimicrobium gellanilyticum]|uniref:Peptidoglycan/xylan/chitin deacetylase (PgdA/CDA1 family) n=1 Tax=Roseimicrobium gellanilyticum TaxID=748857 RepID=A0A366HFD5_9BACT|nr:polysaccharide deacetylase family protein [Roseimicrobium gellanilyticum]RBP41218.1 peptidoglycan/xylan/chitin deacetylase (PgdA/CDA1 family) [Roseimicrobium gellanilyticum]